MDVPKQDSVNVDVLDVAISVDRYGYIQDMVERGCTMYVW